MPAPECVCIPPRAPLRLKLQMTLHPYFFSSFAPSSSPSSSSQIARQPLFLPRTLSLRLPLALPTSPPWWMDRSSIANLAALLMQLGPVTSLRAGWGGGEVDEENRTERSRGSGVTKRTRHLGGKTQEKIKQAAERRNGGESRACQQEPPGILCVCEAAASTHNPPSLPSWLQVARLCCCFLPPPADDKHVLLTSGPTANRTVRYLLQAGGCSIQDGLQRFTGWRLRRVPCAVKRISH